MPINFNQLYSDYTDLGVEYAKLQKQYDELKAENEALKKQVATLHEKKRRGAEEHRKLFLEHATLKDRAQGLADALGNARKSMVGEDAIKEVDATLQSWNQRDEVLGREGEV